MSRALEPLRTVPIGRLHPRGVCAWCGSRLEATNGRRIVLRVTLAEADVCANSVVDCQRRRARRAA